MTWYTVYVTTKNERAAWREENRERIRAYDRSRYPGRAQTERERVAAWRKANPEKVRAARRRWREKNRSKINAAARVQHARMPSRHHGLTPAELQARLLRQGGRCAVCRTDKPGARGWQGDHDHTNRLFRAVLCNRCNLGLGLFEDAPERLRAAAAYIERHAQLQALI